MPTPTRAEGIDIYSKYQPHYDSTVKAHDFIIIKASDGKNPNEDVANYQFDEIKDVPIRGAYHYMRSDVPIQDQINAFLSVFNTHNFHFAVADFEKTNNTPSMRFGRNTRSFIDSIKTITNKRCLLYSNRYIIHDWMYRYGQYWMRDNPEEYPLWIAQYPYYGWNDALSNITDLDIWQPTLPAGITTWNFWQYSADGNRKGPENGIPKQYAWQTDPSVDLDVYNGTSDDLTQWLNISQPPTPEPVDRNAVLDEVIQEVEGMKDA